MNYDLKYKIAVDLIEKGYIIHCTNANFDKFDSSYIVGEFRAKEGYGFYFSDMPYKPIEYGENWKIVKKDVFNFLKSNQNISLDMFEDTFAKKIYKLEDELWSVRNNHHYDLIKNEIEQLQAKYDEIGGSELFSNIETAIKVYGASTIGEIECCIPNPRKMLPLLAKLYIYYGYDGYETSGIYTIFNIDKLNQYVESVDIEKYKLSESLDLSSFETKDKLNPNFWKDEKLDSRIRLKLLDIADDFTDFLNIDWVEPEDITMTGSLANYNWSVEFSDIDLHIIIDFKKVYKRTEFVSEYFKSKKELWNKEHQGIKIFGFPVEIYVQDKNEQHSSTGIYSLEKNKWLQKPEKKSPTETNLKKAEKQAEKWIDKIDNLIGDYNINSTESKKEKLMNNLDNIFSNIKKERKKGFNSGGDEMNQNNLAFKILRRNGYIDKINNKKTEIYNDLMSINEDF